MDGVIGLAGVLALLALAAGAIAAVRASPVNWRWVLAAGGLVALNDAMLTRVYGLVPRLLPHAGWNWQGKVMALAVTLAVASAPAFGWRRSGLTWRQAPGSLRPALGVCVLYAAVFVALALAFPGGRADAETVAFQLTMPGLEEEPFYRGVLLLALDRAFPASRRALGVDWGWSAPLSCALFGLAHGFGFSHGAWSFEPLAFLLTGGPAAIAVWLRLRTGSVVLPVLLHNFGNAIGLVIPPR